jgi:hypothetical protein
VVTFEVVAVAAVAFKIGLGHRENLVGVSIMVTMVRSFRTMA